MYYTLDPGILDSGGYKATTTPILSDLGVEQIFVHKHPLLFWVMIQKQVHHLEC
jgi:hypothetical protein